MALTLGQQSDGSNVDVMVGQNAVLECRFDASLAEGENVSFTWSHRNIREWDTVAIQGAIFRERYRSVGEDSSMQKRTRAGSRKSAPELNS